MNRTVLSRRTALISAASGIGDIIRVTPLIRAAHLLGYEVDVLLLPDEPEAAQLIQGAPEVRRVVLSHDQAGTQRASDFAELSARLYDVASFTTLSAKLSRRVRAKQRYGFDASWYTEGDAASVAKLARAMGWQEPLPPPFAMKSMRHFDLPKATIALHPGCKPTWPWKKWHGFDKLASYFPNVVVVGTTSDADNSRTYFNRPFAWPRNVCDFTGKLSLRDTAALLSQCSALISVDSGIMHLGVAVGIPTFGIFGITSPTRECMPSHLMVPITKQLPCEARCRQAPWGRRDCEHHLACLRTLSPAEVASRLNALTIA